MIYVLVASCTILAIALIGLAMVFFRAKKSYEQSVYSYTGTIGRMADDLGRATAVAEKTEGELNRAIKIEREGAEELLERAVKYEEKFNELSRSYGKAVISNDVLEKELEAWKLEASKQLSHRKSSEVRTGNLTEQIAPLLEDFPVDFKTARFLGNPIDYVCFTEDGKNAGIVFIEVKSGDSQLSTKQRKLKKLIEEGKVSFEVYRLKK